MNLLFLWQDLISMYSLLFDVDHCCQYKLNVFNESSLDGILAGAGRKSVEVGKCEVAQV